MDTLFQGGFAGQVQLDGAGGILSFEAVRLTPVSPPVPYGMHSPPPPPPYPSAPPPMPGVGGMISGFPQGGMSSVVPVGGMSYGFRWDLTHRRGRRDQTHRRRETAHLCGRCHRPGRHRRWC